MLSNNKILLFFLIFIVHTSLFAQIKSIGTPFIRNYNRSNYNAGSQTWDIEQGNNGMMYFANNDGLLEFDGYFWKIYPLPNNSIVRSIKNGNDSILFAGGFNEFGFYRLDKMGGASYTSLIELLPEDQRDFGEVWNIFVHTDGVIFQTYTQLIFYKNNEVKVIPAPSSFHFSFLVNDNYYVNDIQKGLMRYALGKLHPLLGLQKLIGKEIWGILLWDEELLIATASDGIYMYDGNSLRSWDTKCNQYLKQKQVYSSLQLSDEVGAFGTIQDGLFISDNHGIPLQHINVEDGLQNNTILSIQKDNLGNLWLGTDHGIDYLEIASPITELSFNYGLSAGYTAIKFEDNLYLGTNQGLFVQKIEDIPKGNFGHKEMHLIEETRGQVWSLKEIDGQLFCGHNNGTFIIRDKTAEQISDLSGGWTFVQVPGDPLKVIGGHYLGLSLYQKINGKWTFKKLYDGFLESSRSLAFDSDGSIWMAHGYKGLFHLQFDTNYDSILRTDFYNSQNSKVSSFGASLAEIDQEILVTSDSNVLMFSSEQEEFIPYKPLNKYFSNQKISSLQQDKSQNIWYFKENNSAGVLRIREDGEYSNINLPFQQIKDKFVKGFEFVYPLDEKNVFFGAEKGFFHYNPSMPKNYTYPFHVYLRLVKSLNHDAILLTDKSADEPVVLGFEHNDVGFVFAANEFSNPDNVMYSTYLEGFDNEWSNWQRKNTRDFTNLWEGKYIFRVKAKNIYGTVTREASIVLRVLPPYYRSLFAYIIYVFVIIFLLLLFGRIMRRRFNHQKLKEQKDQEFAYKIKEEKFQREALEAEQQIIRFRNEKLRDEMKLKDKELANGTMQILHKNEVLIAMRDDLKAMLDSTRDEIQLHQLKTLIRQINKEIDNKKQWHIFETQFENVHEEFLKRIKTAYPELSPREMKLCAFLRMNISSKEISVLMNISTRGVEISRYRLRKKLGLDRKTNLTDFIISY